MLLGDAAEIALDKTASLELNSHDSNMGGAVCCDAVEIPKPCSHLEALLPLPE